jgi:2-oxo-3-hexenedioate decarboxylase
MSESRRRRAGARQTAAGLAPLLDADPHNPSLQAGAIVSTGTLTLAMPVQPGQTWTAKACGILLESIALRFEA